MLRGGIWIGNRINFDSLPDAMNTLFSMSTTENWSDYMVLGGKITDVGWVMLNSMVETYNV